MRLTFVIITCFYPAITWATQPRPSLIYLNYSENGAFYYKATPYSYFPSTLGKTVIYETSTGRTVDSIGEYVDIESFLSNDGRMIFQVVSHADESQLNKWPVVLLFTKGRKSSFYISDIVQDSNQLNKGWPRTSWHRRSWMHNDSLFILTRTDQSAIIDLELKVHFESTTEIEHRFKSNVPKDKKVLGESVKYRRFDKNGVYDPLFLKNNKSFLYELIAFTGMKESVTWEKASCGLHVKLLVDKHGKGEVWKIEVNNKTAAVNIEAFSSKITSWIHTLDFKTNEIPETVEKWLFEYYVYME